MADGDRIVSNCVRCKKPIVQLGPTKPWMSDAPHFAQYCWVDELKGSQLHEPGIEFYDTADTPMIVCKLVTAEKISAERLEKLKKADFNITLLNRFTSEPGVYQYCVVASLQRIKTILDYWDGLEDFISLEALDF